MNDLKGIFEHLKLHEKLNLKVSNQDEILNSELIEKLSKPHKSQYYFFIFVIDGAICHDIEFRSHEIHKNEIVFILPNQIHHPKSKSEDSKYFKIGLDKNCLALLPKDFIFLINPLQIQKIKFDEITAVRIKNLIQTLHQLLKNNSSENIDLIMGYLNTLFIEVENSYFLQENSLAKDDKLSVFVQFKKIVELNFNQNLSIENIAQMLHISTNQLYTIVKKYAGKSPKEYLTNRLILEAIRKLHYSDLSIKELGYELGFSNSDYFAKTFKKETGKTISSYLKELQDL